LPPSTLSPLQQDLLEAFFRRESRFFLTGGGALAGFYLGHRTTADLDLFVTTPVIDDGEAALRAAAAELGASAERVRTAPDFRRWLVKRGDDGVVVDLVLEHAPQGPEEKRRFGAVRVDPPGEILANKLCTLLSRAEPRDLVDVYAIERAGHPMDAALSLAREKDGGLTPAQLAWVLTQITIGDGAKIPGNIPAAELRTYVSELCSRLTRLAYPAPPVR
jgi:hypothetical protein